MKINEQFVKWPIVGEHETRHVNEVLSSGNLWRMSGSKVEEFEKKFAEFIGAKHCLAVTNGTHAIELSLASLGIGDGDEVLVSAFTFISTATAPIYCNATPIPIDVLEDTFCIDPDEIEKAITPKTKAIIPVHMAGHGCDMDKICAIAKKHNLKVVEDCAHAHGAEWRNKKLGTYGDISIFSFQNGKLMTSGEGGAIVTNNSDLYERAYLIHGVGRPKNDIYYEHLLLGSNYRMSEVQAALLLGQLEKIKDQNETREANASYFDTVLRNVSGIRPQERSENVTLHSHYMYMFYYDKTQFNGLDRKEFVQELNNRGVPAFIAYPVVSDTKFFEKNAFRGHIKENVDTTTFRVVKSRKIAEEVVWLPHFLLLGTKTNIDFIVTAIEDIRTNVSV